MGEVYRYLTKEPEMQYNNISEEPNPLVSIVIPIYNVEDYLIRCLDSIVNIDYSPIEVILVDDASTDNCGKIIDNYVSNNLGWIAIHKSENEGVAEARITGEIRSTGDFVMFIDPDDYVHPAIISRLVSTALRLEADIVTCGFYVDDGQNLLEDCRGIDAFYDKDSFEQLLGQRFLYDETIRMAAFPLYMWGKVYKNRKKVLFEHLKKGSGIIHAQDLVTMVSLLTSFTGSIACIKDPLYYYVKRPGQITGKHPLELFSERVRVWEKLDEMNDGRLNGQMTARIWAFLKYTIYYSSYSKYSYKQYKSFIQNIRDIKVINKYLFGSDVIVNKRIRRHPHFVFIKYQLYCLDYLFSKFIVKR